MKKILLLLLFFAPIAAMAQNDINIGVYDTDKTSADDPTAKGKRTETIDTIAPATAGVNVQAELDGDSLDFESSAPLVKLIVVAIKDNVTTKIAELDLQEQKEGKIFIGQLPEGKEIKFSFRAKDGSEAEILMDN